MPTAPAHHRPRRPIAGTAALPLPCSRAVVAMTPTMQPMPVTSAGIATA